MLLLSFLSQLKFDLNNIVDEGETTKEFKDSEIVVSVDAGERNSLSVFLLIFELDHFEAGDTLSDDKDGVCLLGELSLGVLLGNLVVLL
jgi:hypothetical protein